MSNLTLQQRCGIVKNTLEELLELHDNNETLFNIGYSIAMKRALASTEVWLPEIKSVKSPGTREGKKS